VLTLKPTSIPFNKKNFLPQYGFGLFVGIGFLLDFSCSPGSSFPRSIEVHSTFFFFFDQSSQIS